MDGAGPPLRLPRFEPERKNTMNPIKIQSTHLARRAYVYVRQSTPLQVLQHQESTERQYHLQQRAVELGWSSSAIEIIDEDQGRSGTTAVYRTGFQRLTSDVSLGKVGLVLMLEASRLARNNSDWHRLIEICGVSRTLIADEGAVYDPREPNDRLLLGVKGTLSEAELFTLRTRLYEGRWNKARKGQLSFALPVGYVLGEDGRWELDPDTQVRERLAYVFDSFRRRRVVRQVVRDLQQQGWALPVRITAQEGYGTLVWKTATLSAVVRLLHNPAYAGAYVYGRWDYSGERRSPKSGKVLPHLLPMAQWPLRLPSHHPGYLSWEEFEQNQEQLRQNWHYEESRGVTRNGEALLTGLVFCGVCGRRMSVQNHARRESRSPTYLCGQGYQSGEERICQSMTSRPVDAAVVEAFLAAVSPLSLTVSLQVLEQVERDLAAQQRQQQLQLEQARYEARLAQRQYDAVDPEHRLVASELERRWNEKLERVTQLEQSFARSEQPAHWHLTAEERVAVRELSQNLPAIWRAETTTPAERKQLLRFAIETVQLEGVSQPGEIEIQIRWHSGTVTGLRVKRVSRGDCARKTPSRAVERIQELAHHDDYGQIAQRLNEEGWQTAWGHEFTAQHVGYLCRRHQWARGKPSAQTSPPDKTAGQAENGREVE
jgi:DNA invertase Pin-like site-specific DNA recombinase